MGTTQLIVCLVRMTLNSSNSAFSVLYYVHHSLASLIWFRKGNNLISMTSSCPCLMQKLHSSIFGVGKHSHLMHLCLCSIHPHMHVTLLQICTYLLRTCSDLRISEIFMYLISLIDSTDTVCMLIYM